MKTKEYKYAMSHVKQFPRLANLPLKDRQLLCQFLSTRKYKYYSAYSKYGQFVEILIDYLAELSIPETGFHIVDPVDELSPYYADLD